MKKFIKKYILLISIVISGLTISPVKAMKEVKYSANALQCKNVYATIPQTPKNKPAPAIEMRFGTQRNRIIKECFFEIISAIKSLFQNNF